MTDISTDLIGSYVDFDIYGSAVIPTSYKNCQVLAIGTYKSSTGPISPAQTHAVVYPYLPQGTPNDYKAYQYLIVQLDGGSISAVGIPWIIEGSLKVIGTIDINVTIYDKGITDVDTLKRILTQNGFTNFAITTTEKVVD